jgi:hypothetical protein
VVKFEFVEFVEKAGNGFVVDGGGHAVDSNGECLLDEVERNPTRHGEVLRGVFSPGATLIFAKRDSERPVQRGFDAPIAADGLGEGGDAQGEAGKGVAAIDKENSTVAGTHGRH